MCGISGIVSLDGRPVPREPIEPMITALRHRGPDGFGLFYSDGCVLGHARLSIIDLEGGWQPIFNEDGTKAITFNGEIYNYIELRKELESRGHRFYTNSDTEVIVHAYETWGSECPMKLNGQFAFGIYDMVEKSLFLCRDRFGVRPLYYAVNDGIFLFGSEVKALLASGLVSARLRVEGLHEIHNFWGNIFPNTPFERIFELPPSSTMSVSPRGITTRKYWELPDMGDPAQREADYEEGVLHHLARSIRLRLRADVPVGAYLSGGLDSSLTATLVKRFTTSSLRTFSLEFEDPKLDESQHQAEMVKFLGTDHKAIRCAPSDIVENFDDAIWAAERPLLRTAPAPMLLLSRLVKREGFKVVVTGEGADEVFLGYDIFREAKVREFCGRVPASRIRPLLLRKLYPYLFRDRRMGRFQEAFFMRNATMSGDPFYGHRIRWEYGSRIGDFYSPCMAGLRVRESDLMNNLKASFASLPVVERTQLVEMETLLSGYLLSSQGDRVGMANSVESRYPFLDHELVEYVQRMPLTAKLSGLREKSILKKIGGRYLPDSIVRRDKFPYRAPDIQGFLDLPEGRRKLRDELEAGRLRETGIFDAEKVGKLMEKAFHRKDEGVSTTDNLVLMAVLSGQIFHRKFFETTHCKEKFKSSDRVRIFGDGAEKWNQMM